MRISWNLFHFSCVRCCQLPIYGYLRIWSIFWVTEKAMKVLKFFWCHSFFNTLNFNKSILVFASEYTLPYPLAFVSSKKVVSCVSFLGFCFLVTCFTKNGHDYRKWRQPPKEHTWPKTKPRILRELEIRRLKVILSKHFVVKGLLSSYAISFSLYSWENHDRALINLNCDANQKTMLNLPTPSHSQLSNYYL